MHNYVCVCMYYVCACMYVCVGMYKCVCMSMYVHVLYVCACMYACDYVQESYCLYVLHVCACIFTLVHPTYMHIHARTCSLHIVTYLHIVTQRPGLRRRYGESANRRSAANCPAATATARLPRPGCSHHHPSLRFRG
jgi:hypothetical protein